MHDALGYPLVIEMSEPVILAAADDPSPGKVHALFVARNKFYPIDLIDLFSDQVSCQP